MVLSNAWPIWSCPVILGGGITIVNGFLLLSTLAWKYFFSSHLLYSLGSISDGLYVFSNSFINISFLSHYTITTKQGNSLPAAQGMCTKPLISLHVLTHKNALCLFPDKGRKIRGTTFFTVSFLFLYSLIYPITEVP